MTKAWVKTSGTSTAKGASVLFFGFHWSFTILEPSGKGWPLPGMPALYAWIIVGLATITLSTWSVRAEETTAQSSYPLKSENAIPPGDCNEYLSCGETAATPKTASTAVAIPIVSLLLRSMADPCLNQDFHFGCWMGHSISHPPIPPKRSFSPEDGRPTLPFNHFRNPPTTECAPTFAIGNTLCVAYLSPVLCQGSAGWSTQVFR